MAPPRRILGTVKSAQPAKRRLRIAVRKGYRKAAEQLKTIEMELHGGEAMRCRIKAIRFERDSAYVDLVPGVTRDNVDRMRGATVFAPEDFRPGQGSEFELDDLLGFEVADTDSGPVGKVGGVMDTKAGGVLQIERTNGGAMLLPVIPEVISEIDWDAERIVVHDIAPYAVENDGE